MWANLSFFSSFGRSMSVYGFVFEFPIIQLLPCTTHNTQQTHLPRKQHSQKSKYIDQSNIDKCTYVKCACDHVLRRVLGAVIIATYHCRVLSTTGHDSRFPMHSASSPWILSSLSLGVRIPHAMNQFIHKINPGKPRLICKCH